MRLNYSEDEDFPGQCFMWQANCDRSLRGKKGQAALRRLEAALVAMPTKRLIRENLSEVNAEAGRLEVCALGAVAMMEDRDEVLYADLEPTKAGELMGFPRLVAWKIVEQNDIQLDQKHITLEGPERENPWRYGSSLWKSVDVTPEERYDAMLCWVRSELPPATKDGDA